MKDIRRRNRKQHSAEEKIRIVLEGLRGGESIGELCRRERIATSPYFKWSKDLLEAGKKCRAGDTARQASAPEVKEIRSEASALKKALADVMLENRLLKPDADHIRVRCPFRARSGRQPVAPHHENRRIPLKNSGSIDA